MLALVDGDVLCYLACKSRWVDEKGNVLVFSEEDKALKTFTKEQDRYYLEECWQNFNTQLHDYLENVFATQFLMAVKSESNYRDSLYPLYKANRKAIPNRNEFVPILRKLAVHEGVAIEATGREADDLLRMWAEQAKRAGDEYVIMSNDKDLKCIPGKHYDIKRNEFYEVSEEYAVRFSYQQLLSGDSTDNVPGLPGIGPVKAAKFIAQCQNEEEMQEVVVALYEEYFGSEWKSYLLSNGKMIYIQKHESDFFCVSDWPSVRYREKARVTVPVQLAATSEKKMLKAPKFKKKEAA